MEYKFNINDKVIYQGIIGIVEGQYTSASGTPHYSLVAEADSEMSCSAPEEGCKPYQGQEIEQDSALGFARLNSARILNMVDGITDKHYRDGNH